MENPERAYSKVTIFAQNIDINITEEDYLVFLSLNLLEAVSKSLLIPVLISRILVNNLVLMMQEREEPFTKAHKEFAM